MSTAVQTPQQAFGADARSLKDLIEAKERELSELGDYRVSSLEAAVKERDEKLRRLQATIGRLRDDFGYNLKLVEERDVELAAAEEAVRCLEDRLRDSDLRKRELTKDVADRNEKLDRAARALAEREATWRQQWQPPLTRADFMMLRPLKTSRSFSYMSMVCSMTLVYLF